MPTLITFLLGLPSALSLVRLSASSAAGPGGLPNKTHTGTLGFLVAQAEGETDLQLEQIIIILPVQVGFGPLDEMLAEKGCLAFSPLSCSLSHTKKCF